MSNQRMRDSHRVICRQHSFCSSPLCANTVDIGSIAGLGMDATMDFWWLLQLIQAELSDHSAAATVAVVWMLFLMKILPPLQSLGWYFQPPAALWCHRCLDESIPLITHRLTTSGKLDSIFMPGSRPIILLPCLIFSISLVFPSVLLTEMRIPSVVFRSWQMFLLSRWLSNMSTNLYVSADPI